MKDKHKFISNKMLELHINLINQKIDAREVTVEHIFVVTYLICW
jgi:hypothetical protein